MSKQLLVADSSPTIQRVVEVTFDGKDVEVVAASDGETALQLVRELRPDVVLADVEMPSLDGISLCRAMRSDPLLLGIPCILLTNAFGEFDEGSARAAGATSWLAKPFEAEELVAKVEAALGEPEAPPAPSPHLPGGPPSASVEPAMEDFALDQEAMAGAEGLEPRGGDLGAQGEGGLDTETLLEEAEELIQEEDRRTSLGEPPLSSPEAMQGGAAGGASPEGGPPGEDLPLEELGLDASFPPPPPVETEGAAPQEGDAEGMDLADLLDVELSRAEEEEPQPETPPADAAPAGEEAMFAPPGEVPEAGFPPGEETPPPKEGDAAADSTPLPLPGDELRTLVRDVLSERFEQVVPRVAQIVAEAAREMAPAIVERVIREEVEKLKRGE